MIRVIDNWKKAWKFASVQINVIGLLCMSVDFLGQTWNSLPPYLHERIPNASTIALVLFALGIIGRLLKLGEKSDVQPKN